MTCYTKAVLAVVALSVLALPVRAEEKVWYCEMTGVAQTTIDGDVTYKTDKFKMKITADEMIFGTDGFFDGEKLPITYNVGGRIEARTDSSKVVFSYNQFHFAMATSVTAWAITARCDDF